MLRSALELFGEHGVSGTGFRELIAHSGAPRGSIYHHFPGGKAQLAQETVGYAADVVATRMEEAVREAGPVAALHAYLDWWRHTLVSTDFRAGCPILAVTVESGEQAALAEAAATAFERWERQLAGALRMAGLGRARSARLATLAVAAIEGAVVLSRARRDTRPLDEVARELDAAIDAAAARRPG